MRQPNLTSAYYPLWLTYAIVPLAAGLDKFFYLLVDWDLYIAPAALRLMPFSGQTFMYIVGVIEIAVGILAFTPFRRLAAYITSLWLLMISVNLLLGGFYDIAVRDLSMAVGAMVLGQLHGIRGERVWPQSADAPTTSATPATVASPAGIRRHHAQPPV